MSRRGQYFISFLVLFVSLSACSPRATGPANTDGQSRAPLAVASSVRFVRATTSEAQISPGGSGEAIVRVEVQGGYHVNANPPTYSYLKATELTLQPGDGLVVGFITYPTAVSKKFSFADKPLAVYEGEVPIKVMLKAARSTPKGSQSVPAKLNIQACDDQVCYPPGTLEISIPVTVK